MSETNALQSQIARSDPASWFYRLTICLPLVFVIGAPSIFITRSLFKAYNPEDFVGDMPTISGTASHPPAGDFFKWSMLAVTVCIFISWSLNLMMNARRLAEGAPHKGALSGPALLNWASCTAGMLAGLFLTIIGFYTLNDGHDVHMLGSWVFYLSQVIAILLDVLCIQWMRHLLAGSDERFGWRARIAVGSGILTASLVFLWLYLTKDQASPDNYYPVQVTFVASEYVVALLCFAYPFTGYAEMRRHYRALATPSRRRT